MSSGFGSDRRNDYIKYLTIIKEWFYTLAIFDAFEILNRIQEEENLLEDKAPKETKEKVFKGFAEGRSK